MGEIDRKESNEVVTYDKERQKLNDLQKEYKDMEARMVALREEMSAKYNEIMQQRDLCESMLMECPYEIHERTTYFNF